MNLRCVPIAATLSARGEDGLTSGMERHVEECLRCRRELLDRRAVLGSLAELRDVTYPAPAEVRIRVMESIGPWSVPAPGRDHRATVAAAAAVATAAATAAAGTAVLLMRHRQRAA
jgi:hypothetical protein